MVSGNTPPAIDGVCHYTQALLGELRALRPEWEWLWVGRRQRWFHAPLVTERGVRVLRPSHTWRSFGTFLAGVPIRLLRPDILHIQDEVHSFHETGAATHLARAAVGRVITTLHEFHSERASVRQTVDLVRCSNVLIANDARTAERCARTTGRSPDFTWWSGTNVPPSDPSWGVRQDPGLVTTFGQLSPIKALHLVHEGLMRLRQRRPEVRWQIVGPFTPATDPIHAELKRRFWQDWVRFTGEFDDSAGRDLRMALASGQIMLLPFADGASPRRTSLQAAWAFGLPVVTTPPEVEEPDVMDGVNCVLVREPTPAAWAEAIECILADSALRTRLREGSLATAARFRWSRLARLHLELYDAFGRRKVRGLREEGSAMGLTGGSALVQNRSGAEQADRGD